MIYLGAGYLVAGRLCSGSAIGFDGSIAARIAERCPRTAFTRVRIAELPRDSRGRGLRVVARWEHELRPAEQAVADTGAAEHIHLRDLARFLVGLGYVYLLQIAEILRTDLVTFLRGGVAIEIPEVNRGLEERRQRDVRVAMLRAPFDGFRAQQTGNPDRRMRLLERQTPRIDEPIVKVFAFISKRAGLGPRLDDDFVSLVEELTVEGGIGVGRELLAAAAADPSADQAAAGNHVDDSQLLGQAERITNDRNRIGQQHDLHALCDAREYRGLDIHPRPHAEGGIV